MSRKVAAQDKQDDPLLLDRHVCFPLYAASLSEADSERAPPCAHAHARARKGSRVRGRLPRRGQYHRSVAQTPQGNRVECKARHCARCVFPTVCHAMTTGSGNRLPA